MSYTPSVIEQVQLDIFGRLMACQDLQSVPIFLLRPRDAGAAAMIQTTINNALLGLQTLPGRKAGAAIVVNMPSGDAPDQEIPGPQLWLLATVRILESPLINMGDSGTGISAEDLMLFCLSLIHFFTIKRIGSALVVDRQAFEPQQQFLANGQIVYDCRFRIKLGLQGRVKTSIPMIAGNLVDGVTVTSATADAKIWYTLDGSYPWSGNPSAVLYGSGTPVTDEDSDVPITDEDSATPVTDEVTTSIAVTAGMLVQAVAYFDNQQASDLAALQL